MAAMLPVGLCPQSPDGLDWVAPLLARPAIEDTAAQADVDRRAGPGARLAGAVNISVFNAGIAVGSAVGGVVLGRGGFAGVHLVAAALVVAGLVAVLRAQTRDPSGEGEAG
ncbi:hypothetical protein [Streptomyces sp. SID3212]|uniref:hypothetical protein n=1 Tax=Streptomyces sp. SID3212 TaxID=2690259 RepID=UPI0013691074|nr:hypothetical protein [Streptomyces sp. SID3212]MYV54005.1 hypothetical protein [Streptomyces sp. SID3212]